jgi:phosphate-selective porin OprO and OprP
MKTRTLAKALLSAMFALTAVTTLHADEQKNAATDTPEKHETEKAKRDWQWDVDGLLQLRADRFDGAYSNFGERNSEDYVRRASVEGQLKWHDLLGISAKLESEDGDNIKLNTLALTVHQPFGDFRIGRFNPDFGLERSTSSGNITAIERSSIWDLTRDNGEAVRDSGIAFQRVGEQYYANISAMRRDGQTAYFSRVVWQPKLGEQRVFHLGLSLNDEGDTLNNGRIQTRGGIRGVSIDPGGVRTTLARADNRDGFRGDRSAVLELLYQQGPFSVQSELLQRRLEGVGLREDRIARGNYVQLAWTITGEARNYDRDNARFGRFKPDADWGALELFLRSDDLSVSGENGIVALGKKQSKLSQSAIGLNWYVDRNTRVSADFHHLSSDGLFNAAGDDSGNGVSLQAQFCF